MITDKIIRILALAFSIIGIISLFYIELNFKPKFIPLEKIKFENEGQRILTSGKIVKVYTSKKNPNFLLIVLYSKGRKIGVPIFEDLFLQLKKNGISKYSFKRGKYLEVEGIVQNYKGLIEVIPKKVSDIRLKND
ncbi:MAG: hypothetical protein B6U78_02355 [Candidatus Aenigmarchaeota archaeon ex4484_224]|nr:MAG: hypothetical protein B6U78_02355 [Candidatus Aenigmarchaeota archaeon ex4484_224]